jgi:hypothetical protein
VEIKEFYRTRSNETLLYLRDQMLFDIKVHEAYPELSEYRRYPEHSTMMLQLINKEIEQRGFQIK